MKLRHRLIKILFTQDEKHLIDRAIWDRCDNLEKIRLNDRWVDVDNMQIDIDDLKALSNIFYYKENI